MFDISLTAPLIDLVSEPSGCRSFGVGSGKAHAGASLRLTITFYLGTSLVVQRLRLCLPMQRGAALHPDWGAEIPRASWPKHQTINSRNNVVTNSTDFKNGPHQKKNLKNLFGILLIQFWLHRCVFSLQKFIKFYACDMCNFLHVCVYYTSIKSFKHIKF